MDIRYQRTPSGNREIDLREHALRRRERTALIVVGQGKTLNDLQRELRLMPAELESILFGLIQKGLVSNGIATPDAIDKTSPLKEAQRYLGYLIGIIENADASKALGLTIALKRAANPQALAELRPRFHESLLPVVGADEAQRLLDKLAL